ncbi:MAG: dihydropteroate synthase [Phycisphaerales bacterium]|nr:MAG: dihydropteroate synthase [Phycisphaerales bacterium]
MTVESLRRRAPGPSEPPVVMGVLNVTPDSFSDGGRFVDVETAVAHATRMIDDGAAIIDVGAESTRPGSRPVPDTEQVRRAAPVIKRIRRRHPHVCISIDTQSAAVARAALDAGADWINDISALRADPAMADLAATTGAPVVLMHMQGTPQTMQDNPTYDDVVGEVAAFLARQVSAAESAGIRPERIVIDPGIGFGKRTEHNLQILARLREIVAIGPAVLIGASRKSFIGKTLGIDDPEDRLAGSLACAAVAALAGARIIRAHDVRETVHAARICHSIKAH